MDPLYIPVAKEREAWEAICERERFTSREVTMGGGMTTKQAQSCIVQWLADGAIAFIEKGERGHHYYRRVEGFERPRLPQGRTPEENMWISIVRLRSFSPTDIAAHATSSAVQVSLRTARDYIAALLSAGYLQVRRKANGNVEARYSLRRSTGPRPPVIRRIRVLEDQNDGTIHHLGGARS